VRRLRLAELVGCAPAYPLVNYGRQNCGDPLIVVLLVGVRQAKVAAQLAEAGVPGIAALPAPLRPRNGSSSPAHPGLLA
jgi:hypothetical protein